MTRLDCSTSNAELVTGSCRCIAGLFFKVLYYLPANVPGTDLSVLIYFNQAVAQID